MNRYNLESVFDDITERLDKIVSRERRSLRERVAEVEGTDPGRAMVEKVARPKLDQLDRLPLEAGDAIKELQDYEWMDPVAEQQYRELMDELQQQVADTYFQNLDQGLRSMTPEAMGQVAEMLHDLNQMLRQRAQGREPDFDDFMKKHGDLFADPKPKNLDELLAQMAQQMERMESMMQSLARAAPPAPGDARGDDGRRRAPG